MARLVREPCPPPEVSDALYLSSGWELTDLECPICSRSTRVAHRSEITSYPCPHCNVRIPIPEVEQDREAEGEADTVDVEEESSEIEDLLRTDEDSVRIALRFLHEITCRIIDAENGMLVEIPNRLQDMKILAVSASTELKDRIG